VDTFVLGREGKLAMYYAPFDWVNDNARVVLVGLTPGLKQMRLAFEACRDSLAEGASDEEACQAAKATASFAGMRARLTDWLDELGVPEWLGIASASDLFGDRRDLLHTTSAIRYPVFCGPDFENYSGHSPSPLKSPLLLKTVKELLSPELAALPRALVVPMGVAVSAILNDTSGIELSRCLVGFPHPSGANGWAPKQFAAHREEMLLKVRSLP
jgi:hypothetical protein